MENNRPFFWLFSFRYFIEILETTQMFQKAKNPHRSSVKNEDISSRRPELAKYLVSNSLTGANLKKIQDPHIKSQT